jgi:F-type H+-transporting ATPase subunit a
MNNFTILMPLDSVLSPLDQFEIRDLISINLTILNCNISLTNIGLYLILSTSIILLMHVLAAGFKKLKLIANP